MTSAMKQQSARLTDAEEKLFQCVRGRVRTYFQEFEELEGFALLGDNVQRLLSKVEFELRGVFLHQHDAANQAERVHAQLNECLRQQAICDQVIAAARQLTRNAPVALERRTQELKAFYAAELKLQEKQWAVQADVRLHNHVQALSDKYCRQLELSELENSQRVTSVKEELELKKNAEIDFLRVQMRLQLAGQLDRETYDLLGADRRRSRERILLRNGKHKPQ